MPETRPLTSQIGALERPGQALQNTIMGDLPGAFQAMFTPQDLSIKQRDAFLKEYGLDKGPWAPVFRLLTNPASLLVSALLGEPPKALMICCISSGSEPNAALLAFRSALLSNMSYMSSWDTDAVPPRLLASSAARALLDLPYRAS